jgi:hypothetical protein
MVTTCPHEDVAMVVLLALLTSCATEIEQR